MQDSWTVVSCSCPKRLYWSMQWVRRLLCCISYSLTLCISARQTCSSLLVVSTALCSTSLSAHRFVIIAVSDLKNNVRVSSMGFGFSMRYVSVSWGVASYTNWGLCSELVCVFFTHRPGLSSSIYVFWTDSLYYVRPHAASLRMSPHTASTVFCVTRRLHLHVYRNIDRLQLSGLFFFWSICCCLCLIGHGRLCRSLYWLMYVFLIYLVRFFADPMLVYVGVTDVLNSVWVWSSSVFFWGGGVHILHLFVSGAHVWGPFS